MASRAALRAAPKLPCGIAVPHALSTAAKSSSSASNSSVAAAIRRALAADSGSPPHTTAIYSDSPVSSLWRGPMISYSPIPLLRGRSVHGPSVCFALLISHRPFSAPERVGLGRSYGALVLTDDDPHPRVVEVHHIQVRQQNCRALERRPGHVGDRLAANTASGVVGAP